MKVVQYNPELVTPYEVLQMLLLRIVRDAKAEGRTRDELLGWWAHKLATFKGGG